MSEKFDYVDFVDNLFMKLLPNNPKTASVLTWITLVLPPILVILSLPKILSVAFSVISGNFILTFIALFVGLIGGVAFGSKVIRSLQGPWRNM